MYRVSEDADPTLSLHRGLPHFKLAFYVFAFNLTLTSSLVDASVFLWLFHLDADFADW